MGAQAENHNGKMNKTAVIIVISALLAVCRFALAVNDPVAHWKFDEGNGTTAYDSAGSNDGTVTGATWTTGQIGGALDFDGVNDYVKTANNIFTNAQLASGAVPPWGTDRAPSDHGT